jgi:Cu2+-exporting ATPase
VDVKLLSSYSREQVLAIAAALERDSAHPLAAGFRVHEVPAVRATDLREVTGEGIQGVIDGETWRLGKYSFVSTGAGNVVALVRSEEAGATLHLGGANGVIATFRVGAPLRPDAAAAIRALRQQDLAVVIASGDSQNAVRETARALGITQCHSRLSPADKIWLLNELRARGHRSFVVGDGINDGPVLAAAEVSCAMGQGSAIAQSAADLLLVSEDLTMLPAAVKTARAAMRVVRQNLAWSLVYNLSAVPAAALGLISPWLAALGMSLSSLAVVLNARRLARDPT